MKLSIIVPVYNMAAGGKLAFCLDSLINQTISDYEIICVDDASADNSVEVLEQYSLEYPEKLRYVVHERNKRQGGAKNTGLKSATGEWVGFIDSDDWIAPDFYEKLLKKAEETGADMVGCDYNLVHEHTFEVGETIQNNTSDQAGVLDEERHKALIMRSGSMVIKIYKHQVIKDNHLDFPEGIFYEDNCAGPVWSVYFKHFEKVNEPLYYYYQHDTSTVHYVTEEKCRDRMIAGEKLLVEMDQRGFLEQYHQEIEYRFTELYFENTLFSYMLGARKKRIGFVEELKAGIQKAFPEFRKNKYFQQYAEQEHKEMIDLLMQSTRKFYYVYGLKVWVRGVRKKLGV
ncbi:MAG: glycosyltransferase [Lachnospiraceae bacterium]|nr:glycosyltransferase [Lachnospiraceae bacterium]